jgi:5-methylcytosine-specific restriction endonuclease McrA
VKNIREKKKYPENWKEIRGKVLSNALHACQRCGAPNKEMIARGMDEFEDTYMLSDGNLYSSINGEYRGRVSASDYVLKNMVKVILSVCPEDGDLQNLVLSNLYALCQKCKMQSHAQQYADDTKKRKRKLRAVADLF